jgi:hypothetical protein
MVIDDIYSALKARGLTCSLWHFSTRLLGMAPDYAADTGLARCSADALLRLHRRLGELRQADLQERVVDRLQASEARDGDAEAVRPRPLRWMRTRRRRPGSRVCVNSSPI